MTLAVQQVIEATDADKVVDNPEQPSPDPAEDAIQDALARSPG